MCGGLWPRGLEPRWHSRVICWTFNLFCLLPRPARRCFSPSFPREVIRPYRAYVPRLMRSKVVFEYLRAAADLRFSVRRQKSRHAGMLSVNLYPACETREKKKTGHSHFRHVARAFTGVDIMVIIVMSKYPSSRFRSRENRECSLV